MNKLLTPETGGATLQMQGLYDVKGGSLFKKIISKYGIVLIAVFMVIICSFASPYFFTGENLINILRQVSVSALLAFGMTLLIIMGCIDLSVGSVCCMAGILSILTYATSGSLLLAMLVAVIAGGILSAISGTIIAFLRVPPFIATLAMNLTVRGAVMIITEGKPQIPAVGFKDFGQGYLWIIPLPVIVFIIIAIITHIILKHTTLGRKIYAVGGNEEAAIATGINVKRTKVITYMISGLFVGLAGIMLMSRVNSGMPTAADGYELDAIASAVIGGTSFTGGLGTAFGTVIGAIILGIISNILNLIGVQTYIQSIIKGVIILVAVVLDLQSKRKRV